MASTSDEVIEQFIELRGTIGVEVSLKHRVEELANEEGLEELAAHLDGLTESEYYDFILAARRYEPED